MTFSKFLNFLVCTLNSSLNSTLRLFSRVQSSRLDAFHIRTPRRRRGNKKTLREKKREKRRKKEAKKSIENDKEEMKTSNVKKEKIQKGLKENKSAMLIKRRQSKDILSLATIYWQQQLSKYLMSRAMTFIQSEIDEILSFHCISSQDFSRRSFSTSLCPCLRPMMSTRKSRCRAYKNQKTRDVI